jgi:hypothetical protein
MINIESEIFNIIANEIREKYPGIYITGEYVKSPPSFPCVSLVEMDNAIYTRTQSSDSVENHVELMYELNVYSNKKSGKKSECKAIASLIDNELAALGFSRTMLQPIPNMDDATIYRILGRYRAVVSKDKQIYRR